MDTITKTSICTHFGQRVQADLLFVKEEISLILIDDPIRCSVTGRFKNPATIIDYIVIQGPDHHGLPEQLLVDQESGIMNDTRLERHIDLTQNMLYYLNESVKRNTNVIVRRLRSPFDDIMILANSAKNE
eukprot:14201486-Heterocapsa_arctica.AAC.1